MKNRKPSNPKRMSVSLRNLGTVKNSQPSATSSPVAKKKSHAKGLTFDDVAAQAETLIDYLKDLRKIESKLRKDGLTSGFLTYQSEDKNEPDLTIGFNDIKVLFTKVLDAQKKIISDFRTAKKTTRSPRNKKLTFNYISYELVDFLRGCNFGNGLSMAFAETLEFNQRVASVSAERAAEIQRGQELARLDGSTESRAILKEFEGKRAKYTQNYQKNFKKQYGEGKEYDLLSNASRYVSVKDNLKLLFGSNVTTNGFLLKLWYLYIRANDLSIRDEGARYRLDERFDDFVASKTYSWSLVVTGANGEPQVVDFAQDDSMDNALIGKGLSKSETRSRASRETLGSKRKELVSDVIFNMMQKYTNITDDHGVIDHSKDGFMDVAAALKDPSGKTLEGEFGYKVRDADKFKAIVKDVGVFPGTNRSQYGVLITYTMILLNSFVIPDEYLNEDDIAVLQDPATAAAYDVEMEYLTVVLDGLKLADSYDVKLDQKMTRDRKKEEEKGTSGSPKVKPRAAPKKFLSV